jgi:hypothetical protein
MGLPLSRGCIVSRNRPFYATQVVSKKGQILYQKRVRYCWSTCFHANTAMVAASGSPNFYAFNEDVHDTISDTLGLTNSIGSIAETCVYGILFSQWRFIFFGERLLHCLI